MPSIQTAVETMRHHFSTVCGVWTMFASLCPPTNSSLATDVYRFEILDLDVSGPLTTCFCRRLLVATEHGTWLVTANIHEEVHLLPGLHFSLYFLKLSQFLAIYSICAIWRLGIPTFCLIASIPVDLLFLLITRRHYSKKFIVASKVAQCSSLW